jgi:hypothetical protein
MVDEKKLEISRAVFSSLFRYRIYDSVYEQILESACADPANTYRCIKCDAIDIDRRRLCTILRGKSVALWILVGHVVEAAG